MRRTLGALVAGVSMMLALAACEPTGDRRCDQHVGIVLEIQSHGWTVDCTPGFPNRGTYDGQTWFTIWGWADADTRTVWVWPDAVPSDDHLRYVLWHELAHVRGITGEDDADAYSWCREPLFGRGPSTKTCAELGA